MVMTIQTNPMWPKSRVAADCNVSAHTVRNILGRIREDADDPLPRKKQSCQGARKINREQQQVLADYTEEHPFVTALQFKEHFHLTCSVMTMNVHYWA